MRRLLGGSPPDPEWLEQEFVKRGPWVTQYTIDGKTYGGKLSFDEDVRIRQFFDNFPEVHSILDLGSLEGGQTFQLAKHPGVRVLGVEGRQSNIDRAEFVQRLLGIKNVKFVLADLEKCDMSKFGRFDCVFCSGILYHLPEPWKLIEGIRTVTNKLFIWSHYAADDKANEVRHGFRGWWYQEFGIKDPMSGLSPRSFWLTFQSLQDMFKQYGFIRLKILQDYPQAQPGPCTTLVCSQRM
ncbi:class I SAM-dependent methyltransferase [Chloroflexota bacterium]